MTREEVEKVVRFTQTYQGNWKKDKLEEPFVQTLEYRDLLEGSKKHREEQVQFYTDWYMEHFNG